MSIWKNSVCADNVKKSVEKTYVAGYTREEWEKVANQFKKDCKTYDKHIKDFGKLVTEIIGYDTNLDFATKTGLTTDMYYRLKNKACSNDPPKKSTLISFAVGYDLDIVMTRELFLALGLEFNYHNPRDYAYAILLTMCRGKDIEECNEILKNLNIDEKYFLGQHTSRKRSA